MAAILNNVKCVIQQYNTVQSRLATFVNYPTDNGMNPLVLAESGLYFVGPGDKVKCAYCLGRLYNFEAGDDPFLEHSKHFKKCRFVQFKRKYQEERTSALKNSNSNSIPLASLVVTVKHVDTSKSITIVKRLGYDESIILKAVSVLRQSGIENINSAAIIDTIESIEEGVVIRSSEVLAAEPASGDLVDEIPSYCERSGHFEDNNQHSSDKENLKQDKNDDKVRVLVNGDIQKSEFAFTQNAVSEKPLSSQISEFSNVKDPKLLQLFEEHKKMKEVSLCNKCVVNKSDILCLPCRHLVTCVKCTGDMDNCYKCAQKIVGTVRVFLI